MPARVQLHTLVGPRRCSVAPTDQNRNVMTQVGIPGIYREYIQTCRSLKVVVLQPGMEWNKQNRGLSSLGQGKTFLLSSTAWAVPYSSDQRLGLLHTVQYGLQGDLKAIHTCMKELKACTVPCSGTVVSLTVQTSYSCIPYT